jgi:HK97 family phage major capsid protein/HK97 family phage prohead protease
MTATTQATQARKIKTGTLHRSATFERAAVDEESRTVELAFSSEEPYGRWFGTEILDHDKKSIRLGRLKNGGPLLLDHDTRSHVGVIESVDIGPDRVGRAVVRFGRSAAAEEAFNDVKDGIRKHVSVGYRVHKMRLEEEGADGAESTYRVTDWEPLEVSIVAVPADATVGIGRSDDSSDHETEIEGEAIPAQPEAAALETTQEKSTMPHAATDTAVLEAQFRADVQKTERARVDAIIALGEAHAKRGMDKLAVEYVRNGKSLEEFRSAMLDRLAADTAETDTINLNQREAKEYSYVRAIAAALGRAEGQNVSGFEVEISQDIERNMPANYKRNGGIFVPLSLQRTAISEALYNTSGKGASTVFTQPGEFIDMLRNASVAVGLGARVMSGLTGPVSFPSQTAAATAYWMPENDGTDVTASNATLSSVSLTPKTLQATTAFSRQLMAQASMDVEAFIRNDLAAVHALAWDVAVMHGTGSNNQPTGIYTASNVNAVAMGGVPTFGKLVDMVTEVLKDNALAGSLAFATTPGMAGKLAQTVVAASTDTRMIWGGPLDNGNLAGYKAIASNQVSAVLGGGSEHGLIFGNWADAMIGMWGALELVVDPYAKKKQGMIEVTSFQLCDVALRHVGSFCKATGATIA